MKEVWKCINGYDGLYQVSNLGRVKSLDKRVPTNGGTRVMKGKILKGRTTKYGYLQIGLTDKNNYRVNRYVHRLVAEAFIPNPQNKKEVNHIDCNKKNNGVDNLEWVNRKENMQHASDNNLIPSKLVLDEDKIIDLYINENMTVKEIAKEIGVFQVTISKRLKKHNIHIKKLEEICNKHHLENYGIEEQLKFKSQYQIAKEIGCTQGAIQSYIRRYIRTKDYIKQEKKESATNE